MKNSRRILTIMLAGSMMAIPSMGVLAINHTEIASSTREEVGEFIEFKGKIEEVYNKEDGLSILVLREGSKEDKMIFHLPEEVGVFDASPTRENKRVHLVKGAEVSVYTDRRTPVALSFPGQTTPEAVVIHKEGEKDLIKLDRFNKDLVSSDGSLRLNIEDEKEAKEYEGKILLVYYTNTTRSLPAQTTPKLVVDLGEKTSFEKILEKEDAQEEGEFIEFRGKIKEVSKDGGKESILVAEKDRQDNQLLFHLPEEVGVFDARPTRENKRVHLVEGAEVSVYYSRMTPVTASLPGQTTPEAVVIHREEDKDFTKLDRFNKDLVSSDGSLELLIENKEEAKKYEDKILLVYYTNTTRSLPAQTTPKLVVDLGEKTVFQEILEKENKKEVKQEEKESKQIERLDRIKYKGREEKVSMYRKSQDVTMISLRDLANIMDYDLEWKGKTKPMEMKKDAFWTSLELGKNSYFYNKVAPFELSSEPLLRDGKTYVPIDFIDRVLGKEVKLVDGELDIK